MGARFNRVALVWVCAGAFCASTLFQNCGPSFQQIDFEQKQSLLRNEAVFGGKAYFIYPKKRKLRALEEGGNYANFSGGGEGSIPTEGPNGEAVIPVEEPHSMMPAAGSIPVASNGMAQIEMQGGVMVGPNWYQPPPPPKQASVPGQSSSGNGKLSMIFGIIGSVIGAIGAFASQSSSSSSSSYSGYDPGPASSPPPVTTGTWTTAPEACTSPDARVGETIVCSPLLIAFAGLQEGSTTLELTHPYVDGRFFDIAGTRSWPAAHT